MLKSITRKLIATVDTFPASKKPIDVIIKESSEITACARYKCQNCSYKNNTIEISRGMIDLFEMNENYLSFVIAHELVHIYFTHLVPDDTEQPIAQYFSRDKEREADLNGMKINLKAGYSYKGALNAIKKMKSTMGDYSSFEAIGKDHPSWTQRLEYLDSNQTELWRTMCTFENGAYFLEAQNYEVAIILFNKVVKEFPKCYEAYANLGYARLMQYFHGFNEEDQKDYTIGQLALGGFYRQPASLQEKIKGRDESKWWEAIGYMKQSLLINENQALVKANLGIAYYFDPRKLSLSESTRYFDEAAQSLDKDESMDDLSRAVVYNNLAALGMYNQDQMDIKTAGFLTKASRVAKKVNAISFGSQSAQVSTTIFIKDIVEYNDNLYRYNHQDTSYLSLRQYEIYLENFLLKNASNPHVWWNYMYTHYEEVCKKNNHPVKPMKGFLDRDTTGFTPPVTNVICNDGSIIFLSQSLADVNALLGKPDTVVLSWERKLFEYVYPDKGIRIVGNEEVIMISLVENSSCSIVLNNNQNRRVKVNFRLPEVSDLLNISSSMPFKTIGIFRQYFIDKLGICLFLDQDQYIRKIQITQYPYLN